MKGYQAWIALRYLKVRSREFFISLISWISVGGVAVGVAALIVVMSVMNGFEGEIRDKVLGANAHGRITAADGGPLQNYGKAANAALSVPGVVDAEPFVEARLMLMAGQSVQGVELKGFDPEHRGAGKGISGYLLGVSPLAVRGGEKPGVFVGKELAVSMGLMPGDLVRLVSPGSATTPAGAIPRFRVFRVAGYFVTGMYEYDRGRVYVDFNEAADFLRLKGGVSGVELKFADLFQAERITGDLKAALGDAYRVRDWTEMNRSLFGALRLEKLAMYLILGLIILVAAFNIASTLTMVVMEKARDIGILKALGVSRRGIRNIFLVEGGVIGGLGAFFGVAAGTLLAQALKRYEFITLPQDVYYNASLPVVMDGFFVLAVAISAFLLCLGAASYPSWRAARLNPVETLRYE